MEAKEQALSYIKGQKIYKIPFFQRTYVWNQDNWEAIWDELSSPQEDCFLGAIILKAEPGLTREVTYKAVVDGQQRLTTLTVLLRAMNDHLYSGDLEDDYENFLFYTKTVKTAEGKRKERKYKLMHSHVDSEAYQDVIDGKYATAFAENHQIDENAHSIVRCYQYFRKRLEEATDEQIEHAENKLTLDTSKILVFIELNERENEQAIFDTINSAGVKLTTADIIKNALYQHLLSLRDKYDGEQEVTDFYEDTWKKTFEADNAKLKMWLETKGVGHNVRTNIDLFFHTYAQAKGFFDAATDKVSELAGKYKKQLDGMSKEATMQFIREICDYAVKYANIFIGFDSLKGYSYSDDRTRLLQILNAMHIAVFDPYILKQIMTVEEEAEQSRAFRKLESFVLRNYVIGNSTRQYNKQVSEMLQGKFDFDAHLADESISDEKIRAALRYMPVNKRAGLVLFWIELHRHTNEKSDLFDVDLTYSFEVEHVMPQAWRQYWGIADLPVFSESGEKLEGEAAEKARTLAVYALGNMTLLRSRLNKEIQNYPFKDKVNGVKGKKGLRAHTSFSITKDVVDSASWNEAVIWKRTDDLTEEFLELWPIKI